MRTSAIILLIVFGSLAVGRAEPPQSAVIDMALMKSGQLISRCQDEAGNPVAVATVSLSQGGIQVAGTTSGPDGWFMFHSVPPGLYRMRSGTWQNTVRIWTAQTAPPAALPRIALILESGPAAITNPTAQAASQSSAQKPSVGEELGAVRHADALTTDVSPGVAPHSAEREVVAGEDIVTAEGVSHPAEAAQQPTDTPLPSRRVEVIAAAAPTAGEQADSSDAVFRPFLETASVPADSPLPVEPDPATTQPMPTQQPGAQVPNAQSNNVAPPGSAAPNDGTMGPPGSPPEMVYQPVVYQTGPTVGDVVLASAAFGGIAVGAVALYKYDNRKDRVRNIVSP